MLSSSEAGVSLVCRLVPRDIQRARCDSSIEQLDPVDAYTVKRLETVDSFLWLLQTSAPYPALVLKTSSA
jgi:hypothetical protein